MPIIGWLIGSKVNEMISGVDHWIAFILLLIIGIKIIYEAFNHENTDKKINPVKGWNLVFLSVATSIDALVVGFSLAMINVDIWFPSLIIGLVTGTLSIIGIIFGVRLGKLFGKKMELLGGLIIIGIGIKILLSHMLI